MRAAELNVPGLAGEQEHRSSLILPKGRCVWATRDELAMIVAR